MKRSLVAFAFSLFALIAGAVASHAQNQTYYITLYVRDAWRPAYLYVFQTECVNTLPNFPNSGVTRVYNRLITCKLPGTVACTPSATVAPRASIASAHADAAAQTSRNGRESITDAISGRKAVLTYSSPSLAEPGSFITEEEEEVPGVVE